MRSPESAFESGTVTCSCPMTSAKTDGRYLRYKASDIACDLRSSYSSVPNSSSRKIIMNHLLGKSRRDPSRTRQSTPTLAVFLPWGSSDAITSREGSGLSIVIATDRVHLLIRSEPGFTLSLGPICAGGFA